MNSSIIMLLMLRRCVVLLLFVVEISNTASTFEAAKQPQQEEDEAVILQQKVDIDFLPLAKDLLSKLQHVQIYIHHGRIIGNIVVERSTYSGENDEMRELLAYCDLEIVDIAKKPDILAALAAQKYLIEEVDFVTMLSVVQSCNDLQIQRRPPPNFVTSIPTKNTTAFPTNPVNMWTLLKGIVPGTKWCGVNDLANSYHDLGTGSNFEVDKCCRAHDHCPVKVHSFSVSHGATNYHPYTKSHCACDDLFYRCLKNLATSEDDSEMASKAATIGQIFFNVFKLECAEPKYPKVCLHTTKVFPGSKGHEGRILENKKTPPLAVAASQKRFWFGILGDLYRQQEDQQKNIHELQVKDWQEICTEWVTDTDATPSLYFRRPKTLF